MAKTGYISLRLTDERRTALSAICARIGIDSAARGSLGIAINYALHRAVAERSTTVTNEEITEIEVAANAEDWWDHNVYSEMASNGHYVDRDATCAAYVRAVSKALHAAYPAAKITVYDASTVPGTNASLRINGAEGHSLTYLVEADLESVAGRMDELTVTRTYSIETCSVDDLTALDLRRDAANIMREGEPVEAALVTVEGQAEPLNVLYCPEDGRAGIADGADAEWTDASSVEDAVQRYLGGGMQP